MRYARFILPTLLALTAAACARKQPVYYVMDPSTGQPVPVVQQYGQPAQPQYAQGYTAPQPAYAQPQQAESGRPRPVRLAPRARRPIAISRNTPSRATPSKAMRSRATASNPT